MKFLTGLLLAGMFTLVACKSVDKTAKTNDLPINYNMNVMAQDIQKLVPYVYSPKDFSSPKNKDMIASHLRSLEKHSGEISQKKLEYAMGEDPLTKYSLKNIKQNITLAQEAFEYGNFKFARAATKNLMSQCFMCHTRTDQGVQFDVWNLNISQLKVSHLEKADLFIATRQFDRAIEELDKLILRNPPTHNQEPFAKEEAIKKVLISYVRVKNDPAGALTKVNAYINSPYTPKYVLTSLVQWRKKLEKWLARKGDFDGSDIDKQIAHANRLIKNEGYEAGLVDYLQLSSILHSELKSKTTKSDRARSYFRLGKVYNVLKDSGFWDLPVMYFEACVFELPNSKLARSCYKAVEQEITLGFTGSAGTYIPPSDQKYLDRLKEVSGAGTN